MSSYRIIDEPKIKPWEHLIVNPIIILLAGIIVPLFWTPPFFGRFWMPFAWLVLNSYLLGSPTFWKEFWLSVLSPILLFGIIYIALYFQAKGYTSDLPSLIEYLRISVNALFFFMLYMVVFKQNVPYEIYEYTKEDR